MLQDNTLIFAEDDADVAASTILELDGSALSRAFVFCTLPSGLTAASITYTSGNAVSNSAVTALLTETHAATTADLAKGYMFFPVPLPDHKYAQVAIDITGTPAKDFVCGITDAPDNFEAHVSAGYTA